MAGHHNHNAGTTYKCVDSYPERLQGVRLKKRILGLSGGENMWLNEVST